VKNPEFQTFLDQFPNPRPEHKAVYSELCCMFDDLLEVQYEIQHARPDEILELLVRQRKIQHEFKSIVFALQPSSNSRVDYSQPPSPVKVPQKMDQLIQKILWDSNEPDAKLNRGVDVRSPLSQAVDLPIL